jgi:hypothetical protein
VASAGRGATPAEAHAIYNNYSGFWGSYRVGDQKITYRPEGAVNPSAMGQDIVRSFTLKGDRLTVESATGQPDGQDQMRWTWDRVPPLENLTPANRQLLGDRPVRLGGPHRVVAEPLRELHLFDGQVHGGARVSEIETELHRVPPGSRGNPVGSSHVLAVADASPRRGVTTRSEPTSAPVKGQPAAASV